MNDITVVGSANIDYVLKVDRLPEPGETISADDLVTTFATQIFTAVDRWSWDSKWNSYIA